MKNIDKLFSEKLTHHEVTPPAVAWDTLAEALQRKRRKRRVGYWSVAATLLLIGTLTTFIVGLDQEKEAVMPISQESSVVASPLVADGQFPEEDQDNTLEQEITPVTHRSAPERVPSEKSTPPVASSPVVKEPTHLERPMTTPPVLAERNAVEVSLPTREKKSANQTLVVDATRYKRADTVSDKETESVRPSEVTVIYQPNPSTLAKRNSLGQRIDKTLTFIQDHGIGFSELRSAKSTLVNKVFSNQEAPERSDGSTN